jgi:hypothetical protein
MAEFALLSGLNYTNNKFNDKEKKIINTYNNNYSIEEKMLLDDLKYSIYNSDIIKKTTENINNFYQARSNDVLDPKKYLIPVYYNSHEESGPSVNNIDKTSENFETQFNLQTFNNNNFLPKNEANIYGNDAAHNA